MPSAPRRTSSSLELPTLREIPSYLIDVGYRAIDAFLSLTLLGKVIVAAIAVAYAAFTIVCIRLGPHGLLEYLASFAGFFIESPFGPLLLILIITVLSFPPTFGYGTAITLCGVAYGSPTSGPSGSLSHGWLLASTGCMVGATTAFLVCRYVLVRHAERFAFVRRLREGREWKAMEKAVERKGWKMIVLIRFCPFPFVYSNLFFASLKPATVPMPFFLLATLATTPKLFLHVFVGAQTYEAIQAGRGGDAAGGTTGTSGLVRWLYIIGASALSAVTSWYIYRETKKVLDSFMDEDEEADGIQAREEARPSSTWPDADSAAAAAAHNGRYSLSSSRRRPSGDRPSGARGEDESWGWSDDEQEVGANATSDGGEAGSNGPAADRRSGIEEAYSDDDGGLTGDGKEAERQGLINGRSSAPSKSRLD
ncbi:unnamed protein product [Jaminaea pallidilutea]